MNSKIDWIYYIETHLYMKQMNGENLSKKKKIK